MTQQKTEPLVYRIGALIQALGLSRPTIYRRIKKGEFPPPIELSDGTVGWPREDIEHYLKTRRRRTELVNSTGKEAAA